LVGATATPIAIVVVNAMINLRIMMYLLALPASWCFCRRGTHHELASRPAKCGKTPVLTAAMKTLPAGLSSFALAARGLS
jgi:hypothetical protein